MLKEKPAPRPLPKFPHEWAFAGVTPDIPTRICLYCGKFSEGAYMLEVAKYQECKPRADGLAPIRDRKT